MFLRRMLSGRMAIVSVGFSLWIEYFRRLQKRAAHAIRPRYHGDMLRSQEIGAEPYMRSAPSLLTNVG